MRAITSPGSAHSFFIKNWPEPLDYRECAMVAVLDRSYNIITHDVLFKGGRGEVSFDVYVIFEMALRHRASCIVLAHNHPSGEVEPSTNDVETAQTLSLVAEIFDMKIGNLIITRTNYFILSFFD
jgi:DNA repair protein RadC